MPIFDEKELKFNVLLDEYSHKILTWEARKADLPIYKLCSQVLKDFALRQVKSHQRLTESRGMRRPKAIVRQ